MKKYFILLIALLSFEKSIIATKMTPEGINNFHNTFRTKRFSEITKEINSSILLNPEIPQSWAGYSVAQNITYNKNLTFHEKKKAIEMIIGKAPSEQEKKRVEAILHELKKMPRHRGL